MLCDKFMQAHVMLLRMKTLTLSAEMFRQSAIDLFWSQVDRSAGPDACWPWTGIRSRKRNCVRIGFYGRFHVSSQQYLAHRVAYVLTVGPILPGVTIDHVYARGCLGDLCCNPGHLEPVSQSENSARYQHTLEQLVYCKHGHMPRRRGSGPCGKCRTMQVAASQAKYADKYREMKRLQKQKERARLKATSSPE